MNIFRKSNTFLMSHCFFLPLQSSDSYFRNEANIQTKQTGVKAVSQWQTARFPEVLENLENAWVLFSKAETK